MPKMRLLTSVAGDRFAWSPGEVVEVDEETARVWCDGVRAERVEATPPKRQKRIEKSVRAGSPEQAVTRHAESE